MKVTTSDLLAILRRFERASDEHVPRHIDQIKHTHPSPINQMVQFRFERNHYYALFDETAEDRASYILDQLRTVRGHIEGELLENPTSELTTYGLPFKGKDVYLFIEKSDKKRLDILLAERHPETSRSTWQKHIKAGRVHVNGQPAKNSRQEVSDADSIAIQIPDMEDHSERQLPILYLDDHVIVVNKPAGVLTHTKGAISDEFTVADFFRRYTSVGLETNRPGVVHRLDRDTSGIIIGARTDESFALLKSQFSDRKAKKTYLAVVAKPPRQPSATIDVPIGRNPTSPSTFRADSNGKPAITDYEVIAQRDNYSLIKLQPRTGRTHQLRVHLAHIGSPILGDRLYGKPAERLYLHALQLEITTAPETRQTFFCPPPSEFRALFPEVDFDEFAL